MNKRMNDFKNRMKQNQVKSETRKNINTGDYVKVALGEYMALIDRRTVRVSERELKEQIVDLFNFKKDFKVKEKIQLSEVSDSTFDLQYVGILDNNPMFICC